MSYKSREKKRRRRAALGQLREKHGEAMRARHYLTITTRPCCCNRVGCGRSLRPGDEAVYRHTPRETLCVTCAELAGISYRPSQAWERRQRSTA
jgi:hypothetical protein